MFEIFRNKIFICNFPIPFKNLLKNRKNTWKQKKFNLSLSFTSINFQINQFTNRYICEPSRRKKLNFYWPFFRLVLLSRNKLLMYHLLSFILISFLSPDVAAAVCLQKMPNQKKGSFMFMAIEGGVAEKRKENADKERNETAYRLWDISCCQHNVFNKTNFTQA